MRELNYWAWGHIIRRIIGKSTFWRYVNGSGHERKPDWQSWHSLKNSQ